MSEQFPDIDWAGAWNELRGYVQEATVDGMPFQASNMLAYMDELRDRMRAPVKEWLQRLAADGTGEEAI